MDEHWDVICEKSARGNQFMRLHIAIIIPYIQGIFGQRIPLMYANKLSEKYRVDLIVYKINLPVLDDVRNFLSSRVNLRIMKIRDGEGLEFLYSIKYMYWGLVDYSLSLILRKTHMTDPYDAILIITGGEGAWIPTIMKRMGLKNSPKFFFLPMDPPHGIDPVKYDHILEHHINKREKVWIAALSVFHKRRLNGFDNVLEQSIWTSRIFESIYYVGTCSIPYILIDEERFSISASGDSTKYIAVPTVDLYSQEDIELIKKLNKDGISMVLFGPRKIEGLTNRGYVSDDELIGIIGNASATLFLFHYEGFGLIPLESLAVGTPVITQPKLAPRLQWRDNKFVKFFNDYDECIRACREFLRNDLTIQQREKVRESVEQYFTKNVLRRFEEFMLSGCFSES